MRQDQYKYLKLNRYAVLYSNVSLNKNRVNLGRKSGESHLFIGKKQQLMPDKPKPK